MIALGAGFGLCAISPRSNIGASASAVGTVGIIWLVVTQEVAYGLLLAAQRRQLHRTVAEWYEQTQADDLPALYPLLMFARDRAECRRAIRVHADDLTVGDRAARGAGGGSRGARGLSAI